MSVDYNCCDFCGESIYEEMCSCRVIDEEEIYVCDDCIEEEIENGNLIQIEEGSEQNSFVLTDLDKNNMESYGCIYKRTKSGISDRLKQIEEEISTLEAERVKLLG